MPKRAIRIANCSGFYGDRLGAAAEMVEGGPIDVLTGDYLAELTMAILWRSRSKDPSAGYARTFLAQMEQVLGTCVDRGIRVVANAGGLNPRGLAERLEELADRLGSPVRVASVAGDDVLSRLPAVEAGGNPLRNVDTGQTLAERGLRPVTANAYLGGWGITEALGAGAEVVVTGRVTDAALVIGPAAWWHGWPRDAWNALAGALVAGHVIECGAQCCGGNYPFLDEVPDIARIGFPIAEVGADGSAVITKHPGTGGRVSVGTVTAQLLYELGGPRYLNPDVTARFDSIRLREDAPDRVMIEGVVGEPPPATAKVAVNAFGGFRNTVTMIVPGLDVEAKAAAALDALWHAVGGRDQFAEVDVRLVRSDAPDPATNEEACAFLRVAVKDPDADKIGRAFSGRVVELALANYAGFSLTAPPAPASPYAVYWPTTVDAESIVQEVVVGEDRFEVASTVGPSGGGPADVPPVPVPPVPTGPTAREPLGRVFGARSGDKGGNANVGVWARTAPAFAWLERHLTAQRFQELVPEAAGLPVERHVFANLLALNFVVVGLLGEGVAASTRFDPQAKSLGEYLRAKLVELPIELLNEVDQPVDIHR